VHQDIDHWRLVLSKLGRSNEGDFYSTFPTDSCDGIIIRVEYRAEMIPAAAGGFAGIRQ
jgi:hypothetical protein